MSAPIKITDLVAKSLDALAKAEKSTPEEAARLERRAHLYGDLATAQSAKTANIIAYLNSDRQTWSKTDEEVVRVMLGLHQLGDDEGGSASIEQEPEPEPALEANPEPVIPNPVEPVSVPAFTVPDDVEEPSFA